jgi:excisionase family DNA binding protein
VLPLTQGYAWRNFAAMRSTDGPDEAPEVLSVKQAARELNLSPRAVLHRIHAGTIAAIKLGPGTAGYVIARSEIERAKAAA